MAQVGIVVGISALAIGLTLGAAAPAVGAIDISAIGAVDAGETAAAVGTIATATDPGVVDSVASTVESAGGEVANALITNNQSTWDLLGEAEQATDSEMHAFNRYVGQMGSDFVRSALGSGRQEVNVGGINADILDSGLGVEAKVGENGIDSHLALSELPRYLAARASGGISDLLTVFLKSPLTGRTGPSGPLADRLVSSAVKYVQFPLDWWESYY